MRFEEITRHQYRIHLLLPRQLRDDADRLQTLQTQRGSRVARYVGELFSDLPVSGVQQGNGQSSAPLLPAIPRLDGERKRWSGFGQARPR